MTENEPDPKKQHELDIEKNPVADFYKIEIGKVFDTIQRLQTMSVTVATFLGTANLALYGILIDAETHNEGPWIFYWLPPLLLVFGFFILRDIYKAIIRYYKRAIKLQGLCLIENKYTSFLVLPYSDTLFKKEKCEGLDKYEGFHKQPVFWVFLVVFLVEVGVAAKVTLSTFTNIFESFCQAFQ